jgi:hypothetical protein
VANRRLLVSVLYIDAIHQRVTMEILLAEYLVELRELVGQSREAEEVDYSPSDFPQARLSQRELGEVLAELSESVSKK